MLSGRATLPAWALALAAWALVAHPGAAAGPDTAGTVALGLAGFAAGAALGAVRPWLPGLLVTAAVAAGFAVTVPESFSGGPLAPPLGYGNANGMLLLCAAAGSLVAASALPARWRPGLVAVAGSAAAAAVVIGAQAAAVAAVLLLLWFALRRHGRARWWVVGSGGLLTMAFASTVLLARDALSLPSGLSDTLTEERFRLWSDAVDLTLSEPVRGAGPGRFRTLSDLAREKADLAWAHSAPLQLSAELGLVGLVLFAGLVVTALAMLGRSSAVLCVLLLPALIDYVLHFSWVVVALSVVSGAAYVVSGADAPSAPATGKPVLTPARPVDP